MILGIIGVDNAPYPWHECLMGTPRTLKDILCPIDSHKNQVENGIISVTSLRHLFKHAGCEMKLWFEFNVPYFVHPLDVYFMTRGTIFHEHIQKDLDFKEYGLLTSFNIDGVTRFFAGRIDGLNIDQRTGKITLVDIKTSGNLKFVPKNDHVLQLMLYDYLLGKEDISVDNYELDYYSWDDFKVIRLKADYRTTDETLINLLRRAYGVIETDMTMKDQGGSIKQFEVPEGWNKPDYDDRWQCQYCGFWPICKHGNYLLDSPTKGAAETGKPSKAKDPFYYWTVKGAFMHREGLYLINDELFNPLPAELLLSYQPKYFKTAAETERQLFKEKMVSDYIKESVFMSPERVL